MTDAELVVKKLAEIETYVHELRELSQLEAMRNDVKEERFIAHTLQLAIQAALDVASHIVSDDRLGEPRDNRELFDLLARHDWIEPDKGEVLGRMAGFRNILVHDYARVDLGIVRHVVENRLDDLLSFVRTIRERLGR